MNKTKSTNPNPIFSSSTTRLLTEEASLCRLSNDRTSIILIGKLLHIMASAINSNVSQSNNLLTYLLKSLVPMCSHFTTRVKSKPQFKIQQNNLQGIRINKILPDVYFLSLQVATPSYSSAVLLLPAKKEAIPVHNVIIFV